jgi:hypothetical protein
LNEDGFDSLRQTSLLDLFFLYIPPPSITFELRLYGLDALPGTFMVSPWISNRSFQHDLHFGLVIARTRIGLRKLPPSGCR